MRKITNSSGHMTATERRQVSALIDHSLFGVWRQFTRKKYYIEKGEQPDTYKVTISQNESNDYGKMFTRQYVRDIVYQ